MAGRNREQRIAILERKLDSLKKIHNVKARLQVTVCPATKQALEPIFHGRYAGPMLVKEAEKMTLRKALEYVSMEDDSLPTEGEYANRAHPPTVVVSPTPELLERAQRNLVSPHLLVRAASVKIARRLKWMEERGRQGEYIQSLKAGIDLDALPPDA